MSTLPDSHPDRVTNSDVFGRDAARALPNTAAPVLQLIARSAARLRGIAMMYGAAIGLLTAIPFTIAAALVNWAPIPAVVVPPILALLGAVVGLGLVRIRTTQTALLIEQRAPECRNLIITASEIADRPSQVRQEIAELVWHDAARVATRLDPAVLFPLRRPAIALAGAALLSASISALDVTRPHVLPALVRASAPAVITDLEIIVTPPAYAGQRPDTLHDPASIEALVGSRITVRGDVNAERVSIETITRTDTLTLTAGKFTTAIAADADGFIALAPVTRDSSAANRRLIGLSVRNDQSPRVRVVAPGRDLFAATAPATLPVSIEADDDLGLASLSLRFTKMTGSGEQFSFTEGETPLEVTRTDARTWKARGTLVLDTLKLVAGDMIVYRAIATDRRPGASPTESDSYIVEVTGPGALAAGGFTIDDERDRYAVSQQMLIVFTERLIARRDSLTDLQLREEALRLAAVQRQVRAEFVFMMGGELADDVGESAGIMELNEHAEAEAEDDVLAGRLANRGRLELVRAIRWMSSAAGSLTAVDLNTALTHEKNALDYLQRAFSRTRYILRTLSERERLDLARRLTGTLTDAGTARRPSNQPLQDPRSIALRRVLAEIAGLAAGTLDLSARTDAAAIAQTVLRIDAGSDETVRIAALLTTASDALARNNPARAREQLEQAALQLGALLRKDVHPALAPSTPTEARLLEGALIDALRRAGVR